MTHDRFREPREVGYVTCPKCDGEKKNCDLCSGAGEVPEMIEQRFKDSKKRERTEVEN